MRTRRVKPCLEPLEDRCCPTLTFNFTLDTHGNLTVRARSNDPSDNFLRLSVTAPDTVRLQEFTDASETTVIFDSGDLLVGGNIAIYLPATNDTLSLALNGNSTPAGLYVDGGLGYNTLQQDFTDPGGSIAGSLTATRVNNVNFFQGYAIGGNVSISAGATAVAPNSLFLANATVGGNLTYNAGLPPPFTLNSMTFSDVAVQGSVVANLASMSSLTTQTSSFVTLNGGSIGGSFVYTGAGGLDNLSLDGLEVGGSVYMNLGNGVNQVQVQNGVTVHGDFTIIGGSGADDINTFQGTVGGSVTVLLGDGDNNVNLDGATILGAAVRVTTGAGSDTVTFNSRADRAVLQVQLGPGDDSFTFGASATWRYAHIDGGAGSNTFVNLRPHPASFFLTHFPA